MYAYLKECVWVCVNVCAMMGGEGGKLIKQMVRGIWKEIIAKGQSAECDIYRGINLLQPQTLSSFLTASARGGWKPERRSFVCCTANTLLTGICASISQFAT